MVSRRRPGATPASTRGLLTVLGLVVVLVVGCGSDVANTGYSEENRDAFLAACRQSGTDPALVADLCECTWERIQETYRLDELASLEASLELDSLAPLPEPVALAMAECFVAEADL